MDLLDNLSDPLYLEMMRNLTPYVFTFGVIKGKRILDLGIGNGNGSLLYLYQNPQMFVSGDLDREKVVRTSQRVGELPWGGVNLDAQHVPFCSKTFDLISCFAVIEHLPDPSSALSGLKRVLAEDGVLIMTTPNRDVRLLSWEKPTNSEHQFEYNASQFEAELRMHFKEVILMGIYGQKEHYDYYRMKWHPSYSRFIKRSFTQMRAIIKPKKEVSQKPRQAATPTINQFHNIHPVDWPFYPLPKVRDSLTLFAICGNQADGVRAVFDHICRFAPTGVKP